jgi:hypothetical protein
MKQQGLLDRNLRRKIAEIVFVDRRPNKNLAKPKTVIYTISLECHFNEILLGSVLDTRKHRFLEPIDTVSTD